MKNRDSTFLKIVPFVALSLWDVKRYSHSLKSSFHDIVSLKEILTPYKVPITKEKLVTNGWRIISKINFGGELFLRDIDEINTYKGNLNLVPEDSIIYSKINVRHGCVYYHPKGAPPFAVSSEYPVYTFDDIKVNGYFLQKLLRSRPFKALLNTKATGISKARVKQNDFLEIEIPLPPLSEQERIILNYSQNLEEAGRTDRRAKEILEEIDNYLFSSLGITHHKGIGLNRGLQTLSYASIDKWSLDDIFKKHNITSNKYNLVSLNSICSLITDGTHQTPTYVKEGVVFLSAKNVTKEVIDWENIKYVSTDAHREYCKRVRPEVDDILLAKNGTTGVAAIVDSDREFSIYVSLALLKPIKELVNPRYLLYIINSNIARTQFFSRLIGIGVPNLHLGEIKEVVIPLPPLEVQKEIVDVLSKMKACYIENLQKADQLRLSAIETFEKEIFSE